MAEKDVFGYIWIGRPKPVEELSHEEVIWSVEYSDPQMKDEKLISRLGCGIADVVYEYGGERVPLHISFMEMDDGNLQVYVRIGNCLEFNAILVDPHRGNKGLDALYKELGREAIERHLERQREYYKKIEEAQKRAGGKLIF